MLSCDPCDFCTKFSFSVATHGHESSIPWKIYQWSGGPKTFGGVFLCYLIGARKGPSKDQQGLSSWNNHEPWTPMTTCIHAQLSNTRERRIFSKPPKFMRQSYMLDNCIYTRATAAPWHHRHWFFPLYIGAIYRLNNPDFIYMNMLVTTNWYCNLLGILIYQQENLTIETWQMYVVPTHDSFPSRSVSYSLS